MRKNLHHEFHHQKELHSNTGRRQASFGGVASLFGDDDGAAAESETKTANSSSRRAPSFGGVANLFGSSQDIEADDDAPQVNKVASGTSGAKARQPSFGGVAALFGDDDVSSFQSLVLPFFLKLCFFFRM